MIHIILPTHLRRLANVGREVTLDLSTPVTLNEIIDGLESNYPSLRGIIREYESWERRAYLRFFALGQDISNHAMDEPLPEPITSGAEPLRIVGAMSGG